jgi:hypothetical protein
MRIIFLCSAHTHVWWIAYDTLQSWASHIAAVCFCSVLGFTYSGSVLLFSLGFTSAWIQLKFLVFWLYEIQLNTTGAIILPILCFFPNFVDIDCCDVWTLLCLRKSLWGCWWIYACNWSEKKLLDQTVFFCWGTSGRFYIFDWLGMPPVAGHTYCFNNISHLRFLFLFLILKTVGFTSCIPFTHAFP